MARDGTVVYSPVTMVHPILTLAPAGTIDHSPATWNDHDEKFIAICSELRVVILDDVEPGREVRHAISFFERAGMPIQYIDTAGQETTRT